MLRLEVREGDIAAVEADAVANAANDALWMGAGVAGALKRAGGDEIEREAMAQGPIELGSAVATTAGRLRARWVIHGAVMGQDLRTTGDLVRRTTRSCLALADALGSRSARPPAPRPAARLVLVAGSPTRRAAARSRCPPSAPASAASRSASARGSWSPKPGA